MEAFVARRICSFCLKQGVNHARMLHRGLSSVSCISQAVYVKWVGQCFHRSNLIFCGFVSQIMWTGNMVQYLKINGIRLEP